MKRATLMLAVLSVCGMASASLTIQTDVVPITFNAQDFNQVTVRVVGTGSDVLGAWDGRFDGQMNQIWVFNGFGKTPQLDIAGTPLAATGMTAAQIAADSHMLWLSSDGPSAQNPAENNPSMVVAGGIGIGIGTFLAGANKPPLFPNDGDGPMAIALEGPGRMTNRPLAQIVIPVGQTVRMVGTLADQAGIAYQVDQMLPIPEPATMGLLAAGCVALIIRRRNRR